MMVKSFLEAGSGLEGYVDQELLITNNTFIMAQFGQSDWVHQAVDDAVGIIDVSNPNCFLGPCDDDPTQRGLGNAGVINNLFRTRPGTNQRAMMGIDQSDTLAVPQGAAPANNTNAFALGRVGSSTSFASAEVGNTALIPGTGGTNGEDPFWNCAGLANSSSSCPPPCSLNTPPTCTTNCTPGTLPYPRVDIYDGSTMSQSDRDPGFVGEYLAAAYSADVGEEYPDWRLVPGAGFLNPMKDKGYAPGIGETTITMANGTVFQLPTHSLAPHPFQWDGEGYGNPRVVDGFPDIGHDEIHLLTMTASFSPYSRSHNETGCLNPSPTNGQPKRVMILSRNAAGVTIDPSLPHLVEIHGNHATPPANCQGLTAWRQPPATLVPSKVKATLPLDYQTKYIRFTDVSLPSLPWGGTVAPSHEESFAPLAGLTGMNPLDFIRFEVLDDESTASDHWYFANQAEVFDDVGSDLLRSNLQVEYR